MILRAWRAYDSPGNADAYRRHVLDRVRPQLEGLAGFRGLYLVRRVADVEVEYQVLTLWHSVAAIRAFAGPAEPG